MANHTWKFFRAGGFDQVRFETGADLLNLDKLDQKLWVALASPTSGLQFDAKTLALIDTDNDGRIRAPELLAAIKWVCARVKNPDDLLKAHTSLPLAAINDTTTEGQQLLACAKLILASVGKAEAEVISVEDTADSSRIIKANCFNGDGIITAETASDPVLKAVINTIMDCCGSILDGSGQPGINQAKLELFFAEAKAYAAWCDKGQADAAILPLGDNTAAAAAATEAIQVKVEDFFARCRLAAFDGRAVPALNREEKEFVALGAKDLTLAAVDIAALPLAHIEPLRALPLLDGVNPAWAEAAAQLRAQAVGPLLGERTVLAEKDWREILAKLAPYKAWQQSKAGMSVAKLGLARVREILEGSSQAALAELIAKDQAREAEVANIASLDRLVRYYTGIVCLVNNFVSFRDFYSRRDKAIFQAGTLYLDQRSCDLCLVVGDVAKHALMAAMAGTYLAYCDCVRKSTGQKMQIVAAFTDGDSDNLMAGRNGVFYDRQGCDWDATITKLIDNPISIRQAFWSPYKKFVRFIEQNIAKRAADAEAAANDQMASAAKMAVEVDKNKPLSAADKAKAAGAPRSKFDVGVIAAMGVALGSISTAITGLATGLVKMPGKQWPLLIIGLILLISGPSMLIAWLKLRKRNLGPILDANGWAINAKARINVPFGGSLTQVAKLPPDSQRDLVDPYAEKKSVWPTLGVIALGLWLVYSVLDGMGYINDWTNGRWGEKRQDATKVEPKSADTSTNAAPAAAK